MVGHADDGRSIGGRRVIEPQLVVIGECVGHRGRHVARIPVLAVDAQIRQSYSRLVLGERERYGIPDYPRESPVTAMNVVLAAIVDRDAILDVVDREPCVGDSVCHASDDCRGRKTPQVGFQSIGTADHVDGVPVSVRSLDFRHDRSV